VKPGTYTFTRRDVIGAGVAAMGASFLSACGGLQSADQPIEPPITDPILSTRVAAPKSSVSPGLTVPYSNPVQEAFLYVPAGYKPSTPAPFVLMLHAEGVTSYQTISLFQPYADAAGLVLLSVDSNASTWDIIATGDYGPDVVFINSALAATFNEVNVDPTRVAVEGFSDGASYALAVGRTNGTLFSHVISFSAGIMPGYTPNGMPKFFMSQGTSDLTFDITQTGDVISKNLIAAGYNVDYVRFDGGHEVPDAIVQQAIAWLAT
jgi:phospholipase/carboxylesterase